MAVHELTNVKKTLPKGSLIITLLDTGDVIDLISHKIYIASKPLIPYPERRVTMHTSRGRTGFLMVDDATYEPIETAIQFSMVNQTSDQRESNKSLIERLIGRPLKFQFYSEEFETFEGTILNVTPSLNVKYSQLLGVDLYLQPYRVFNSNKTNVISLVSGDSIRFTKGRLAPILEFTANGNVSIVSNGVTMNFTGLSNQYTTFVDLENLKVYNRPSTNTMVNLSHTKANRNWIELETNKPITWTGTVSGMKVHLNWRSV